jgi:hypothetical protein
MFLICVLSGANAPFLLDAAGVVGVKQEFDYPVLSYGRAYSLKPDQAGPCDVNSGPLFGVHGTMIQSDLSSESRLFLSCTFAERSAGKAYYNIEPDRHDAVPFSRSRRTVKFSGAVTIATR